MWDIAELGLKVKSDDFDVATGRMRKFKDEAGATEMAMNKLARVAGSLAGALVGAFAISKLTAYADAWSDMQSKVGAAVKDMDAAPRLMKRMVEVANASYSPLQQTVEIYARNVTVLREMGLGADKAADFTESLNHMLVITATKGEQAASVQQALTKAMAVGRLQADGLESVLASGGRVAEALAKELGTTTNGLRDMASQGKITSAVIANALLKSLEDVRKQAGEMPATIADGFTRINTNVQAFVGQLDKALGISAAVASGLVAFADSILMVTNSGFIEWIADSSGALTLLAQAALVVAATQLPALISGAVLAITTFRALGATFLAQYYLMGSLTGAVSALRWALAALGGPLGIALAAATAVGIALWKNHDAATPLADSLKKVSTAQRDFNIAMNEYDNTKSAASLQAARDAADSAVTELRAAVEAARLAISDPALTGKSTGNFFTGYTMEIDEAAVSAAEARLVAVQMQLDDALVKQATLTEQQALLANEMGVAVQTLNQEQIAAFKTASDMLTVNQQKLQLLQLEKQYGAESVAYLTAQFSQERAIYFAKVDALNVATSMKDALRQSWMEEQIAAGKTREWQASMDILHGAAGDVWEMLKHIRDTEPGKTWLDTAIAKASTLWSKLSDAAAALDSLSDVELDDAGNPITNGTSRTKKPRRPPALLGETGTVGGAGGGGGGGGPSVDQYKEEVARLQESTAALVAKAAAMREAAAAGGDYKRALAVLEEKQRLLNAAQEAGVAVTPQLRAEVDALATAYVDATTQLAKMQEQTQKGEAAFESLFGAILKGADAAKKAVIDLLLEIARVQFTKGMMSLLGGSKGGSNLISMVGGALSMDGGGYTGDRPRSGGLDGKGGFWAIMHPKETVTDHTKSGSGPATKNTAAGLDVEVRAYVDDDGNWQAAVERISDRSASRVGVKIAKDLTGAVQKINNQNPRRR